MRSGMKVDGGEWPCLLGYMGLILFMLCNTPVDLAAEDKATTERMAWWRDAKFGLFIHWGVYAVPAGTYKGEQIKGIGEWIMRNAEIPVAEYRAFARQFNPVKYRPEQWAELAKEAGMRYVVITSKHHDGFALFPSAVTDWDVVNATPYGKDLIMPLAKAMRKQGLKFGLYYSQAQDWTHPGGAKARLQEGEFWDQSHQGSFDDYLKNIAVPQTQEILTKYHPDILWWDTPAWMTPVRAAPLHALVNQQPSLITNNRLGGGYKGDTDTPEQYIPATGIPGRDWEVCMTMNDTWGYKSYDQNWKSKEDLIHKLVDIVSKGGNFLLNVGPTAEGEIPQASIDRLKAIGAWMKVNYESIYGTSASPFHKLFWGRSTKKVTQDEVILYLHVFDWPKDGSLLVPGLQNTVRSAELLASKKSLAVQCDGKNVRIQVPKEAPDPICSVIKLILSGPLQVASNLPAEVDGQPLVLTARFADIHNPGYGVHAQLSDQSENAIITLWEDERARMSWVFHIQAAGTFRIQGELACAADSSHFVFKSGKNSVTVAIAGTGADSSFRTITLAELALSEEEHTLLEMTPVAGRWKSLELRSLKLIRIH
jgi:alpha-L-fucosidase